MFSFFFRTTLLVNFVDRIFGTKTGLVIHKRTHDRAYAQQKQLAAAKDKKKREQAQALLATMEGKAPKANAEEKKSGTENGQKSTEERGPAAAEKKQGVLCSRVSCCVCFGLLYSRCVFRGPEKKSTRHHGWEGAKGEKGERRREEIGNRKWAKVNRGARAGRQETRCVAFQCVELCLVWFIVSREPDKRDLRLLV